jgi:hypothetical protein
MINDNPVSIVEATNWMQISDLEDIKNFENILKKLENKNI